MTPGNGHIARPRVRRRGAAAIVMVVLLLLINIVVLGLVLGGARDQDLTARRVETIRSFYAAEAGMNMAVRELALGADEDGDATVGSISDDSDDATDPSVGSASVMVSRTDGVTDTVIRSEGRAGEAQRAIEATLEN